MLGFHIAERSRRVVSWPRAALCLCAVLATGPLLLASSASATAVVTVASGQSTTPTDPKPDVSATLEQCVTAVEQAERSATFAGEMTAIPGTAKMEMRIDVLERMPHEETFHVVSAPGLSVWRTAAPGVKSYRYLKEVTNLAAPAFYRAAVRFRWFNAKGRLIRAAELRTPKCQEPAAAKPVEETTTAAS